MPSKRKILAKELIVAGWFLFFLVIFSAISLWRYFSLQVFYYDFGIFQDIIWQFSQFRVPVIEHYILGHIVFLGDHFEPSLILFTPLFWIVREPWILIIEQSLATALGGYVLYRIALKHNLSWIKSLIISTIYLLFAGLAYPLVTDWHPEPTAALLLLLFYYFYVFTNKRLLYIAIAIIFLGFKETNAWTLISLMLSLYFIIPKKRKEAITLAICSFAWGLATSNIIIPFFANREYLYKPSFPSSFQQLISTVLTPEKINLVFISFLSFSFLPIFSPAGLIPVFGDFIMRLVPTSNNPEIISLTHHYNVYTAVFLGLAAIQGWQFLQRKIKNNNVQILILIFCLLISVFVARKIVKSPIVLATNPVFWNELKPKSIIFNDLKKVPVNGTLVTENNLASYLLLREGRTVLFDLSYMRFDPDVIVFDLSSGQNLNDFFPISEDFLKKQQYILETSSIYKRIETQEKNLYIYVRK